MPLEMCEAVSIFELVDPADSLRCLDLSPKIDVTCRRTFWLASMFGPFSQQKLIRRGAAISFD